MGIHSSCQSRFECPPDGVPVVRDWITVWESMLITGVDLGREPISVSVNLSGTGKQQLSAASIDVMKGSLGFGECCGWGRAGGRKDALAFG